MNLKLLKALAESHGVSGREEGVRALIRKELTAVGCKVRGDAMGNVIGFRKGKGKVKVMLAGHMDEIGFVVSHVDKDGFLRFQPCGGFDPRTLMSQRVFVHTGKGPLLGVMGAKPIHVLTEEEIKKPLKVTDYFVDLGLPSKEAQKRVEVGDPVTMARDMQELGECITGKALDNRIGVWLMIEALRKIKSHEVDIYAVATTQEEVGVRGALAVARDVHPDVGLALDVTIACDTPGADAKDHISKLGGGTAIKIMDGLSISNPKLVQELRTLARRRRIKFQMEILPRGGTDAGAMRQVTGQCAVGTISVPLRYVHSTVEMVHKDDLKASVDLLAAYLQTTKGTGYELNAGR
ncbi:M42 family metallopeptidase [bacterium]|nr:M42 family metallopeptidase [bacterium]MBU1983349.1 M42 family metallopeptidase [bacterium]